MSEQFELNIGRPAIEYRVLPGLRIGLSERPFRFRGEFEFEEREG